MNEKRTSLVRVIINKIVYLPGRMIQGHCRAEVAIFRRPREPP